MGVPIGGAAEATETRDEQQLTSAGGCESCTDRARLWAHSCACDVTGAELLSEKAKRQRAAQRAVLGVRCHH